ncbi:hypothetical protein ACNSTU_14555 [Aquisalimonas sp. APHAB1-3]|uniref:hypothetical protein n=1 Tax=Aquisalimonas sp. APHAB1-3 TaxID=3402080 RepID=UPI003AAAAE6A
MIWLVKEIAKEFFKSLPEDKAKTESEKAGNKDQDESSKIEQSRLQEDPDFSASPAGRARAAKAAGMRLFQIELSLSRTKAEIIPLDGAYAHTQETEDYIQALESIEKEGWKLEHAGYVSRITGSESRLKYWGTGEQSAVNGEIIGIYIFRRENA